MNKSLCHSFSLCPFGSLIFLPFIPPFSLFTSKSFPHDTISLCTSGHFAHFLELCRNKFERHYMALTSQNPPVNTFVVINNESSTSELCKLSICVTEADTQSGGAQFPTDFRFFVLFRKKQKHCYQF